MDDDKILGDSDLIDPIEDVAEEEDLDEDGVPKKIPVDDLEEEEDDLM